MPIGNVELILILVTLFTAIAGTISNPSGRIKMAIIGLAVLASIGTFVKTLNTVRENEINKRLIVTLVQASNIPTYFAHDLVVEVGSLLKKEKTGQFVSRQIVYEDSGERILVLEKSENHAGVSGVLFFSRKQMNPIFYEYAIAGDLAKQLRVHMEKRWTDCNDHRTECLQELNAIGRLATEILPVAVNDEFSAGMNDDLSFRLIGSYAQGGPICFELDGEFIKTLYQLPPSERGAKLLSTAQEELTGMMREENALLRCLEKSA